MSSTSTNKTTWSGSTVDAIEHLKKLKPYDGWSADIKIISGTSSEKLVRLLRRNVPLTNTYFIDLHYDNVSCTVVGILTGTTNGKAQAQILVDQNGKPINNNDVKIISVTSWKQGMSAKSTIRVEHESTTTSRTTRTNTTPKGTYSNTNSTNTESSNMFTDDEKQKMIKYFSMAVGSAILFRIFLQAFIGIYILALPILYFIMLPNCPLIESFDTKKELKRVLRGHHLSNDNPNKPKGFFNETLARLSATVTAELVTLPGYEITTIPLGGAAIIVCVRVPSVKIDHYWFGAFNKWYFIYSTEYKE